MILIGAYPVDILPSFKPTTELALKLGVALNGKPYVVDRGHDCDIHRCAVTTQGDYETLFQYWDGFTQIRAQIITVIDEARLFGPMCLPTGTYSALIEDIGPIKRTGLNSGSFDMTISVGSLTIDPDIVAAFPAEFRPETGNTFVRDAGVYISHTYDVVSGINLSTKYEKEFNEFQFSQIFSRDEASAIQAWYELVNRGAVIPAASAPTILGVDHPFGPSVNYPQDIRVKNIEYSPISPDYWRLNFSFVAA